MVVLETSGAALTVYRDGRLVGGLMLVQRIASQDGAVPGQDMDRVLHVNALENLVCSVCRQTIDRAQQPGTGVEDVRERVLDSAAALRALRIVDRSVGRPIGW